MKQEGIRFSFTSDEVTLVNNRRYINLVLKTPAEKFNLRLKGLDGEVDAEKIIGEIKNILKKIGLDMKKDIISCTFDGASVMLKVGSIIEPESQVCLSHGLHLAITDVLYKEKKN